MVDKQDGEFGVGETKGDIGDNARVSGVSNENCKSEAKMDLQSSVNGAVGNVHRDFIVHNNYGHNSQNVPKTTSSKKLKSRIVFVLEGDLDDSNINRAKLEAILQSLQEKGAVSLKIVAVEEGSIKITFEGDESDIDLIQKLFEAGELTELEGFPIEDVRDLTEEESQKIDEKSHLATQNVENLKLSAFSLPRQNYQQSGQFGIGHMIGSQIGGNAKVAGVIYETNYSEVKSSFSEITYQKLSQLKNNDLPSIEPNFIKWVITERLLVLGGELGQINKSELILQLAYSVAIKYSKKNEIIVKIWKRELAHQVIDLELELRTTKSPTIFVFLDIEPTNISSSLENIYENRKRFTNIWVLASTDTSFSSWRLGSKHPEFFADKLKAEDVYGQDFLTNTLKKQLGENYKYLGQDKHSQLKSTAQELGNLGSIYRFAKLIEDKQKSVETEEKLDIKELIETAKDSDNIFIRNLFQVTLKKQPRQQLLALGISFLNGLFEDQFFTILERIFLEAWRKYNPSLIGVDYYELEELRYNYFDFQKESLYESAFNEFKVVEIKTYQLELRTIKVLSNKNREELLKIAWETHRRQIINALEVLVSVAKELVSGGVYLSPEKYCLYGDSKRRRKLQDAISDTFSSIGLISISTVNGFLLQLATQKNPEAQSIAASVIATWYSSGRKEEFFRTLQTFYDLTLNKEKTEVNQQNNQGSTKVNGTENKNDLERENVSKSQSKSIIIRGLKSLLKLFKKQSNTPSKDTTQGYQQHETYYIKPEERGGIEDFLGATVAIALGNAIYENTKGQELPNDLFDWLKELSRSRLPYVHLYFGYDALVKAAELHLQQISGFLKEITTWPISTEGNKELNFSLNCAVAISLAFAYRYSDNREKVKEITEKWFRDANKEYKRTKEDTSLKKDDALFIVVALVYGLISYVDEVLPIKLEDACSRLREILQKDVHPLARNAAINATFLLTHKHLDKIEKWLSDLVVKFSSKEQEDFIEVLTEIYANERKQLTATKTKQSKQPTAVENVMNKWVKMENTAAQTIAVKSLVSFAKKRREINDGYNN